jgi:hypothetical protein
MILIKIIIIFMMIIRDQSSMIAFPVLMLFKTILTAISISYLDLQAGTSRFFQQVCATKYSFFDRLMLIPMVLAPSAGILSTPVQFHRNIPLSSLESPSSVLHSSWAVSGSTVDLVCFWRSSIDMVDTPSIRRFSYLEVNLAISLGLITLLKPAIKA